MLLILLLCSKLSQLMQGGDNSQLLVRLSGEVKNNQEDYGPKY